MGEFDVESLALDVIRKQTGRPEAGPRSRFEQDLGLSENGRKALFAFVAEAFSARGVNLPSRRFYLSDFLKCTTPGEVQDAIREALTGTKRKPEPTPAAPATPSTPAPAQTSVPTGAEAPIAAGEGKASGGKSTTRPAKSGGASKSKSKAPVKKKAPEKTKAPSPKRRRSR